MLWWCFGWIWWFHNVQVICSEHTVHPKAATSTYLWCCNHWRIKCAFITYRKSFINSKFYSISKPSTNYKIWTYKWKCKSYQTQSNELNGFLWDENNYIVRTLKKKRKHTSNLNKGKTKAMIIPVSIALGKTTFGNNM